MARRPEHRLLDILDAIGDIRSALASETFESFSRDRVKKAAVERYFEIISEASRHIPDEHKTRFGRIPWRSVADLGNLLRHAYQNTDPLLLWNIYRRDLSALEAAVVAIADDMAKSSDS